MKVPAFVLMRVEGWNRKKEGVKRPSVSTEGQITEEAAPPKRPWKRVCSSLASDVPDGLTNINGSEIAAQFENSDDYRHLCCMSEEFDPSDYSFVVKRRGSPAKPWRWEIYRAGRSGLVECSPGFFEGMAEAAKEGKEALGRFLAKQAA